MDTLFVFINNLTRMDSSSASEHDSAIKLDRSNINSSDSDLFKDDLFYLKEKIMVRIIPFNFFFPHFNFELYFFIKMFKSELVKDIIEKSEKFGDEIQRLSNIKNKTKETGETKKK